MVSNRRRGMHIAIVDLVGSTRSVAGLRRQWMMLIEVVRVFAIDGVSVGRDWVAIRIWLTRRFYNYGTILIDRYILRQ